MSAPAAEPRRRAAALLVAALVLSSACNDGGGDDPIVVGCLAFTAAAAPASGSVTAVDGAGVACESVQVDLMITDVDDVFGLSFDAVFDPAVVAFQEVSTAGSVLESDGVATSVLVNAVSGRVAVGITRVSATGIDVADTGRVLTLVFVRVTPAGATPLTFDVPQTLGSETPPQPKPGIPWSGGTLQVG